MAKSVHGASARKLRIKYANAFANINPYVRRIILLDAMQNK